jgi:hypothetical protein
MRKAFVSIAVALIGAACENKASPPAAKQQPQPAAVAKADPQVPPASPQVAPKPAHRVAVASTKTVRRAKTVQPSPQETMPPVSLGVGRKDGPG